MVDLPVVTARAINSCRNGREDALVNREGNTSRRRVSGATFIFFILLFCAKSVKSLFIPFAVDAE